MTDRQQHATRRPASTVVESFSADLDSMFGLREGAEGSARANPSGLVNVDELEQTVEDKKQVVTEASSQLQALEARLRDAEQRLARAKGGDSEKQAMSGATGASPLARKPTPPADRSPAGSRPQNTREDTQTLMARMPGAMPQTPREHSGSNDYVMVNDSGS
ncbi:hypothetical protein LTR08_001757 [Meristemomyces frigidus]|nr:hypothetical protein LTR08_001757 [Meristemomyces frigidus]